jgi:hypothetical protein
VTGLLVVNRSVASGGTDVLGAPPESWNHQPDAGSFDRALAYADWSLAGTPSQEGVTNADGSFAITGVPAGRHILNVSKTLDGNLAAISVPFTVGPEGTATVIAEVAWGLVKSTSTFSQEGHQIQEIRGPYGTWVVTNDGRIVELGDPTRSVVDADGDGNFDAPACVDSVWECGGDRECGNDRFCACTASCPFCDDCGPGVCVPPARVSPYRCTPQETCSQPGDRCVCVSSCPDCADCTRTVCISSCDPLEITAIGVVAGPSELVVGQQGSLRAVAQLSDTTQIDVTHLATWHSSNDTVATVDSWGTLTARAVGAVEITATIGTLTSAPWSLNVVARPTLQRIYLQNASCAYPLGVPGDFGSKPPAASVPADDAFLPVPRCSQVVQVGATIQFRAVGEFANGYYQDITDEVQWQLTAPAVGDVGGGLFTARQPGTTQLAASLGIVSSDATDIRVVSEPTIVALSIYSDNGIVVFLDGGPARTDVAIPCAFVDARPGACCCPGPTAHATVAPCDCGYSITVLRGDQIKFRATAQYETGDYRDVTDQVTWRSSNTAAATIDSAGVMTAVEGGDATIDAVLGEVTSNDVGVHVVNEATLQSLYIYQDGADRVVAKGDQRIFTATGDYDIGFGRDVTTMATWRSSNDGVGGFDTPGVFTARGAGTVEVWAELAGKESNRLPLEVYETSDIAYCDPTQVNRATWSDNFNRVTLESDCAHYRQPGVVALRYTVTEHQTHGGIFDPCLDLYVYQGSRRVRTIREEGCGDPFLAGAAPGRDEAVLKYQLRAFWDLKGDDGQPVPPGTYTIYGRFYLYYDPVVSIEVIVLTPDGAVPTPTPTPTVGPVCTPPPCPAGGSYVCPSRACIGGCGVVCVPPGPLASIDVGSAAGLAGDRVEIAVSLRTAGRLIAGTQNDLLFDPVVPIAAQANGAPACAVNPEINKGGTSFAFQPIGCSTDQRDCKALRAIVLSAANTSPIPDRSVLYTCAVVIPDNVAPGSYPLIASHTAVSDPIGNALPVTSTNGDILVLGEGGETPPPTLTPTPEIACLPPVCGPGEVRQCLSPFGCPSGCGYVCATPTPVAFCTPIACPAGQVPYCQGHCPDGCPNACAAPVPTKTPEGVCFRSPTDCEGGGFYELRSNCCYFSRLSASLLPFSWCPLEAWNFETSECAACAGDPCDRLPPTTPCANADCTG